MFQARGLGCNKVNNLQPRSPQTPSYAFAHLISPRTTGVRCAMKCLARPKQVEALLRLRFLDYARNDIVSDWLYNVAPYKPSRTLEMTTCTQPIKPSPSGEGGLP